MNYEKETTSIPTYVSLCSGYDGIGIGLKRAIPNLRTVAHCEIEAYAVANLIAKMEAGFLDACPIFTDLKTFPYRELRDKVTILSAGFPCQPFSSAGKRKATEDPRHLYPFIADGVTTMRPRYVLLENVEGIISAKTADGEPVLKYVLGDLEERGYSCTWGVFSASEVGAPHQRKRVFILARLGNSSASRSLQCETEGEVGSESEATSGEGREFASSFEHAMSPHHGEPTRWPARPGEEQYEWEEPRVVADSKGTRQSQAKTINERQESEPDNGDSIRNIPKSESRRDGQVNCQAQSKLGGATDGTQHRVDRLRLLGNGVVPDTCELAFKTLIQQL